MTADRAAQWFVHVFASAGASAIVWIAALGIGKHFGGWDADDALLWTYYMLGWFMSDLFRGPRK